jgi:23S rRNA (cytosine1962-C5)-methyltransferase
MKKHATHRSNQHQRLKHPKTTHGAQKTGRNQFSSQRSRDHRSPLIHRPILCDPPVEILDAEPPQVIAERDGWLVLSKPAGWLTHPDGRVGAEARPDVVTWAQEYYQRSLGVHQRLDVTTSGVIAFSYTSKGAKIIQESLKVPSAKRYLAVVEGHPSQQSGLINKPVPAAPQKEAKTQYKVIHHRRSWSLIEATPLTGRTHQIRAHCAALDIPIRGDIRYGNPYDLRAPRALLHAYKLVINSETFTAPPPKDFLRYLPYESEESYIDAALNSRASLYKPGENTCYRLFNGDPEGFKGWRIDRYDDWQWVIHDQNMPMGVLPELDSTGIYRLEALVDRSSGQQQSPNLWRGQAAPKPLKVYEAGVQYAVELGEQLSTGLFLDQRPQRTWLAKSKRPWGRVLNTFAHAGGFSIAASIAGAETVSIDLSAKWLQRIPTQLELNGINPDQHRSLTGDVFDWLRRLNKRGERFDLIILDPPSTSIGTKKKRWSAAKDYPELVQLALPLLSSGGRLMTCTNHRKLTPYKFVKLLGSVLPFKEGYRLERVCAPGIDFPTDDPLSVKNLIWRSPQ